MLTKVLAKNFWKIAPEFLNSEEGYENLINGNTAGVVIGDRALVLKDKFKFCYDLSGEWKNSQVFRLCLLHGQPEFSPTITSLLNSMLQFPLA
ncbi:MAG: hypothetical protein IPN88_01495 [Bacteroidetes bacterium]|nr:hypothetical protein [Bacteroidota bacterium]